MAPDKLLLEAERRQIDAERLELAAAGSYQAKIEEFRQARSKAELDTGQSRRLFDLVLRQINDTQWGFLKRALKRDYALVYAVRINFIFSIAILTFLYTLYVEAIPEHMLPMVPSPTLLGLYGFWIAIASGFFGAAFSMIALSGRRIEQGTLDDLRSFYRVNFLLIRIGFGAGAAVVIYFLFKAQLISGTMFPDITKLGFQSVKDGDTDLLGAWVPNKDLAALMVWCFLAGFSETLVPAFLDRIEKSGGERPK